MEVDSAKHRLRSVHMHIKAPSCMLGHQKDVSIVSYTPKKNKVIIVSLHHDAKIDSSTGDQKNLEITTFYNSTEAGVDVVDELCANITTDILSKLNINIDALPQKCQQTLQQAAASQESLGTNQLDPIALSLQHSQQLSEKLKAEYEILKLTQKNEELQTKIDRNNIFLEGLRRDLECSRKSLALQSPNPENIQEHIRQMKVKVASYEESCEKAKAKFTKLAVPDGVLPISLAALVSTLATLRDEAATLKQRADDVVLARQARDTFNRLRR